MNGTTLLVLLGGAAAVGVYLATRPAPQAPPGIVTGVTATQLEAGPILRQVNTTWPGEAYMTQQAPGLV